MAGRNNKTPAPRCTGTLKDGSHCRTFAAADGLCTFHLRQRDESASQHPPAEDQVATDAPDELEPVDDPIAHSDENEASESFVEAESPRQRVGDVRAQLAADSLVEYETIRAALLDALKAQRDSYVSCPNCNKRHVVTLPDWNSRVNAVKTLLEQGFGRPQEHRTPFLKDRAAIREAFKAYTKSIPEKPMEDYTDEELMALVVAHDSETGDR
jgi:hypothetical protein